MRIAFCISGHMRNYQKLLDNYYMFKQHYSQFGIIDTFVCTWDKLNTNKSWSAAHNLNATGSSDMIVSSNQIKKDYETNHVRILKDDFFSSTYSPFNYTDMTDQEYNFDDRAIQNDVLHCFKQFGLIYYCNILKKEVEYSSNLLYDFVFRLRPDMQYNLNNLLNLHQFTDCSKIYTSHYWEKGEMGDLIRFAFGGSKIMNKYANSYLRVSQIFDQGIFGDAEKISFLCLSNHIGSDNIKFVPEVGRLVAENNPNDLR
jgi:hypothetical protein